MRHDAICGQVSGGVLRTFRDTPWPEPEESGSSVRRRTASRIIRPSRKSWQKIAKSSARSHRLQKQQALARLICFAFKPASRAASGGFNQDVTGTVRTLIVVDWADRSIVASCSRRCCIFMQWVLGCKEWR